jgi:hypothetical protein
VAAETCLVTVTDVRGIRHTVEVQAESLFEAAALEVRVHEPAVTHALASTAKTPRRSRILGVTPEAD